MSKIVKSLFRLISFIGVVVAAFLLVRNWKEQSAEIEVAKPSPKRLKAVKPATKKEIVLTDRQQVIYQIIKGRKTIDMKSLLTKVSGVTERTLRRDLLKLQQAGLITKQGTTKASSYVLKK